MPIYNKAMTLTAFKGRTFINGDRLTICGTHYTVDDLDKLPPELDPVLLATRTENNVTIFFSINSPLSNHHPANMKVDNVSYSCSEQFYFAKRAAFLGDDNIHHKVMRQVNPREMLRHGRKARNINHVEDADLEKEEIAIMKRGVKEKFSQNLPLKDFLLATQKNRIGESSKTNHYWGTGLHLHHKDAMDTNRWKLNHLGAILEEPRDSFSS
jgi:hypothetical protein